MKISSILFLIISIFVPYAGGQKVAVSGTNKNPAPPTNFKDPYYKFVASDPSITPTKIATGKGSVAAGKAIVIELIAQTPDSDAKQKEKLKRAKKRLCDSILWLRIAPGSGATENSNHLGLTKHDWCYGIPLEVLLHESSHMVDKPLKTPDGFCTPGAGNSLNRLKSELTANKFAKKSFDDLFHSVPPRISSEEYLKGLDGIKESNTTYLKRGIAIRAHQTQMSGHEKGEFDAIILRLSNFDWEVDICVYDLALDPYVGWL